MSNRVVLQGTLEERIQEIMQYVGWHEGRRGEIAVAKEYYDQRNIILFPKAEEFLATFSGLFQNYSLEVDGQCGTFEFHTYPEMGEKYHCEIRNVMYDDAEYLILSEEYRAVETVAQEPFLLIGYIGYQYPANVWVGERGRLYVTHEYEEDVRQFDTVFQLMKSELLGHLPTAILVNFPIPTHLWSYLVLTGEENNEFEVTGTIRCTCGQEYFEVYESNDRHLVKLCCKACGQEIVLLDAGKHGWNGFVCKDDFLDRSVPFEKYECASCGEDVFRVGVHISSQGKQDFLEECVAYDATFKAEDWVDAFEWITIALTCEACGETEEDWVDLETM